MTTRAARLAMTANVGLPGLARALAPGRLRRLRALAFDMQTAHLARDLASARPGSFRTLAEVAEHFEAAKGGSDGPHEAVRP
jgi:hypothetical protein